VQDFKWSSRLSFFPPLHDHDVVTIHLNALDTSPVGLSFGLASLDLSWTCRTFQRLDLSYFPRSQGCIGPFPWVAWRDWTCLTSFGLASLHRSQGCLGPFPWVPWDSFPEQVFLALNLDPCHRVFRELLNSVPLSGLDGSSFFTRPVPEPRNLGELLVQICWSFSTRTKTFAEL